MDGSIEYIVTHDDSYYVVLWLYPLGNMASAPTRIYDWKVTRKWQETSCNIQVSVNNPQGKSITTVSITQGEVERRFDFAAEKSGVYKVVLKNIGESAFIYMRLEEYSTPLSLELAGVSEDLVVAEQEYINRIAEVIGNDAEGSNTLIWQPLLNITLTLIPVVILFVVVFVLKYKRKSLFNLRKTHWL